MFYACAKIICMCVCMCVCVCIKYLYSRAFYTYIHTHTHTPSLEAVAPTSFMVGLQPLVPCYAFHLQFTSGYNHHDL